MTGPSLTPLTPRVPGTYRGRCDCMFWICTKAQLNHLRCPSCGARVQRATAQTFHDHYVIDTVEEPRAEPVKKKAKPVNDRLLDQVDEREVKRRRNREGA